MNFEDILISVKKLLPAGIEHEVLEKVVLQSSFINFEAGSETLFRPGDTPLGFYWILEGEVQEEIGGHIGVKLGAGQMIGLEEFLGKKVHIATWDTMGPVSALFLDRKCFLQFEGWPEMAEWISLLLARQLLEVKGKFLDAQLMGA